MVDRLKLALIGLGAAVIVGGGIWYMGLRDQPTVGTTTREVKPIALDDRVWEALQARPLVLPSLSPGAACPVTPTTEVLPGQRLPGDGPIYPNYGTDAGPYHYGSSNEDGGWYYMKVLWRSSGDYTGPALIRGRQIDGDHELRFESGPDPAAALRFPVNTGVSSDYTVNGWRDNPSFTRIKSPGCYAWQIDGLDFRTVILFEAKR